jgi:hypothetical protein
MSATQQRNDCAWSDHARRRCRQRAVRREAIAAALDWGRPIHQRGGRTAWFLGRREVEHAAREGIDLSSHEGTSVVTGRDGGIITVIRCHDPRRMKRRSL